MTGRKLEQELLQEEIDKDGAQLIVEQNMYMWSCRLFLEMSTAFGFFLLSWRKITLFTRLRKISTVLFGAIGIIY